MTKEERALGKIIDMAKLWNEKYPDKYYKADAHNREYIKTCREMLSELRGDSAFYEEDTRLNREDEPDVTDKDKP